MSIWKNVDHIRCPKCRSPRLYKDGFVNKKQRYRCKKCRGVTIAPKGPAVKKVETS